MKEYRPRLTKDEMELIKQHRKSSARNVLVIADLHCPFDLDSYFDFLIEQKNKYNCNEFVFIGDVMDAHYSSYHESDADGMSAGQELDLTVKRLKRYHDEFPNAYVTIGNHDRIIMRKAQSAGLSTRWIKDYKDVLEVPTWNFVDEVELDGVVYVHGEGGTARNRVKQELQSVVQGHLHSQAYIEWFVGARNRAFAMQVGAGVDRHSYAMSYAKAGKKPVIGCGVVLNNGLDPISIVMDL